MCRSRLIKKLDKFEITVIMTSYMKELLSVRYERRKFNVVKYNWKSLLILYFIV